MKMRSSNTTRSSNLRKTGLLCGTLFCLLGLLAGCASHDASANSRQNYAAASAADTAVVVASPIRLAIIQDKTGSTQSTRTEQIRENSLDIAIGILRRTGGELGFGLLRERADQSLSRLRIGIPPVEPEPLRPIRNPFFAAKEKARYQEAAAQYQRDYAAWQQDTDARIAGFKARVAPLLSLPPNARATDVWDALRRMDAFLAEPDDSWQGLGTRNYGLLITDGIDTVHARPAQVRSQTTWIIVNGTDSLGVLDAIHPVRFEGAASALAHIAAKEGLLWPLI